MNAPATSNHWESRQSFREALAKTEAYLLARQLPDGSWSDYPDIEVGPSLGWTTAYAGYALSGAFASEAAAPALHRAAQRLRALERPEGWSYNSHAACDGDSTAWAVRFLNRLGAWEGKDPWRFFARYVDEAGLVRTFPDPAVFGSWAGPSDEVAPVLALALHETGAAQDALRRITARQLAKAGAPGAPFERFWWAAEDYALCWNALLFENLSLPLPAPLQDRLAQRLSAADPDDAFSAALLLLAVPNTSDRPGKHLLDALLSAAARQTWRPSAWLMVPGQCGDEASTAHLDTGILTAATLLMALKKHQG